MKTKFLTGYKMIKPTKNYKVGLKRAYKQYIKYVYDKKGQLRRGIIKERVIGSYQDFVENYLSLVNKQDISKTAISKIRLSKKTIREIKLQSKFITNLKVAKTAYKEYISRVENPEYTLSDFRKLATNVDDKSKEEGVQSIVGILEEQIKADYKKMRAKGMSSYEARDYISETYFGGKS